MPTSIIAAAAGPVIGWGLNKLTGGGGGGSGGIQQFQGSGFSGGGLSGTFDGTVTPSADRMGIVNNLASTFGTQAGQISGQRELVAPGMNDFLRARLDQLDQAKTSAIGNLRENLARRRVLGSSFGQDAITRANAEFAKQQDQIRADTFLKSLEISNQLMQQEFTARRGQFQTALDEMNLEASLAAGVAGKANDIMSKNAQIMSGLNAQAEAGAGRFWGGVGSKIGGAVGGGIGDVTKFIGGGSGDFWPA